MPATTFLLIWTWNVTVATLVVVVPAFAAIAPAHAPARLAGELIDMPFCSALTPAPGSATAAPFNVVLPAT